MLCVLDGHFDLGPGGEAIICYFHLIYLRYLIKYIIYFILEFN